MYTFLHKLAIHSYFYLQRVPIRYTALENVMNAHEETRLFLVVVNQPENITAIRTRQPIT
jgi:hypothetical protein